MTDWRAVAIGGGLEIVFLSGLVALGPVAHRIVWGSTLLLLATGFVGGAVTGSRVQESWRECARHGFLAGMLGGGYFAALFWYQMQVTDLPVGAFWSLAYLIATHPLPGALGTTYGALVVSTIATLGGLVIAVEGYVAAGAMGSAAEPAILVE